VGICEDADFDHFLQIDSGSYFVGHGPTGPIAPPLEGVLIQVHNVYNRLDRVKDWISIEARRVKDGREGKDRKTRRNVSPGRPTISVRLAVVTALAYTSAPSLATCI
jgi:hypothetical protein